MRPAKHPEISIIVPFYNEERHLEKCLRSLMSQDLEEIEIIAVNDGSTDSSPLIAEDLAKEDSRIKVIDRANGGLSAARNTGLEAARGSWLMFTDSDDYVQPDFCSCALKLVTESSCEIGVFSYDRICADGSSSPAAIEVKDGMLTRDEAFKLLCHIQMEHYMWNKIFRKDIFSDVRFPEGELWEDIAVFHKLLFKAGNIAFSSKVLYHYTQFEGRISGSGRFANAKFPYLQNKKQYYFVSEKYPQYAPAMAGSLLFCGLNYCRQLAARREGYAIFKKEQAFLKQFEIPEWLPEKRKKALKVMKRFPRLFYTAVSILGRKKAAPD